MLKVKELLTILESYNINSQKYGPTIYKNNNEIGLCLEIKDSTFGFLTRYFTFQKEVEVETFLKKYFWFKNNANKYPIRLELNKYDVPNPTIEYKYNNKNLSLEDMLNFKKIITENQEEKQQQQEQDAIKKMYQQHIIGLIDYLINIKKEKENIKKEKNDLKKLENDLKFELLEELTKYYGKERTLSKKAISLDIIEDSNINELDEKKKHLENLSEEELEKELNKIIEQIKEEELDEKNLVNIYSNTVYNYNINILKKQIDFVKSKIEAEKNFNLKGSKLHNIDEELKSFLKTNMTPKKIEEFIAENKEKINTKFATITNNLEAYPILCNKKIKLPEKKEVENKKEENSIKSLENSFDNKDLETKAKLVLYNSMYKNICNYIINNHYPDIKNIKENFDFTYLYNELEEIIFNENNSHYFNTYFKYLNFKDLDCYINSIIDICRTIENTFFLLQSPIKVFYIEENNIYKKMLLTPIFSDKEKTYIINLNKTEVIYIPDKIELDEDTKEFSTISSKNIYIKNDIIDSFETLILNKYHRIETKDKENNIIITTDLVLDKKNIFNIGNIGE